MLFSGSLLLPERKGRAGKSVQTSHIKVRSLKIHVATMFKQAYSSLLNQLEEMPVFLQKSMIALPSQRLQCQPEKDDMPLVEHLWHVRDCDSDLYALRIRRVLQEDKPNLDPVDVGIWPELRSYRNRNGDLAISEFVELRAGLVRELREVDEEGLARTGVLADGSEINVLGLVAQLAEHDRDHRWRIAAILRGFGWPAQTGACL
jgi:DinB superfamily